MPAPIVLFVYNRPEHTRRTIEALRANTLAETSDLIIFSDAPANTLMEGSVQRVRNYIHGITGFRSVKVIERPKNFGLARSIIEGVSHVCDAYGRVIVMEDDLLTSPYFLEFMNEALQLYEHDEKVMHVSGCMYPIDQKIQESTFFFRVPLCWGWATWKRAWTHFHRDISIMRQFDSTMRREFDIQGTHPYWKQLELNKSGKIFTWFIFWYAILFLENGLTLFPSRSLVLNIGHDGTGVHCSHNNDYHTPILSEPVRIYKLQITENTLAIELHKQFFRNLRPHIIRRIIRKLHRTFLQAQGHAIQKGNSQNPTP